jgi:hypothetical protein
MTIYVFLTFYLKRALFICFLICLTTHFQLPFENKIAGTMTVTEEKRKILKIAVVAYLNHHISTLLEELRRCCSANSLICLNTDRVRSTIYSD